MSKPVGERYTIAVDFDGVIHSYTSPWVNAETIPDPPVPGSIEALRRLACDFDVVIFTTRGCSVDGREAVDAYLRQYGFTDYAAITAEKPPALIYIDDRAYRFEGDNWPTADDIHRKLIPWNKRRPDA